MGKRRSPTLAGARKSGVGTVSYFAEARADGGFSGGLTTTRMVGLLHEGLPVCELDDLQKGLGVPMEKLFPMLGISKATFHRRKVGGRLATDESDRVVRRGHPQSLLLSRRAQTRLVRRRETR